MIFLFRLFGKLPLRLNHAVGAAMGWMAWLLSPRHRTLSRQNFSRYVDWLSQTASQNAISQHNAADNATANATANLSAVISAQGMSISELAIAWTAPVEKLYTLIKSCDGWEHVEAAKKNNRPIIFVTPHLGCYDIAGRYLESRVPITALYRAPKQKWLEPIMQAGRIRGAATTAPADSSGVRALLKTLKSGGNIMVLPDQVPGVGDGVWADFFSTPAYTMTLLPRLAASTNAVVLFFFAERLEKGRGYHVHIEGMPESFSDDKSIAARQTNAMVENLITKAPAQYLWGYNRYKQPAGAPLPPKHPNEIL